MKIKVVIAGFVIRLDVYYEVPKRIVKYPERNKKK